MSGPGLILRIDGRQSDTALGIQRGLARLMAAHDHAMLTEFTLASGRRADVMAISPGGAIWIVEIKSSPLDFLSDGKWPEYRDYCDQLSFAIPPEMDPALLPPDAGLIVADAWGAEILRSAPQHALHASRRKAVTLSFARTAALRLQSLTNGFVL